MGMVLLLSCVQQVGAQGVKSTEVTSQGIDVAKNSVVQVILRYQDNQGNYYILKSGTGFLLNKNVVLTSYDSVKLTKKEKESASKYLSKKLHKKVGFTEKEGVELITYQIGIVMLQDVIVDATLSDFSSKNMQLAILQLEQEIMNHSTAILGDANKILTSHKVLELGYPKVEVMKKAGNQCLLSDDVIMQTGTIEEVICESQVEYIIHTAKVEKSNAGGPLVDADGNVIGLTIYDKQRKEESGNYKALSINTIKDLLTSCNMVYQEAGTQQLSDTPVEEEPKQEVSVVGNHKLDTSLLDSYIVNYDMLEENDYTPESYQVLREALKSAKEVRKDKEATQEEINAAMKELEVAKDRLVEAQKTNVLPIVIVSVIIVCIMIGLILYILKLKGIIGKRVEKDKLLTLSQMTMQNKNSAMQQNLNPTAPNIPIPKPHTSLPLPGRSTQKEALYETTVLVDDTPQDAKYVMGVSGKMANAYLVRTSITETIVIDSKEFLIGKDHTRVHYCIEGNSAISRCHAKIEKRGSIYYLSDLNSTNHTYLNGKILRACEEVELQNGDIIHFSNEEFSFYQA